MGHETNPIAAEIADLLPTAAINLRVSALMEATAADLTANQLVVLFLLGQVEKGRLRVGDIARRLSISAASVTGLVDRLVEAGLLARGRGSDRRVVWISLTDDGQRLVCRLHGELEVRIDAVLERMSPEAQRDLTQSLRQVTLFAHQITGGEVAS